MFLFVVVFVKILFKDFFLIVIWYKVSFIKYGCFLIKDINFLSCLIF